jgi:hypothetical protein
MLSPPLLLVGSPTSLGRIGEGVVEGIEGAIRRDRELEAISDTRVLDRNGYRVVARVPEQPDVDAVALANGKFPGLCGESHDSSFSGRERAGGHGISPRIACRSLIDVHADDARRPATHAHRRKAGTGLGPSGELVFLPR